MLQTYPTRLTGSLPQPYSSVIRAGRAFGGLRGRSLSEQDARIENVDRIKIFRCSCLKHH